MFEKLFIKTMIRYHLTPVNWLLFKKKKKQLTGVGEDVEKLKSLHAINGNSKWCSRYGKQYTDYPPN